MPTRYKNPRLPEKEYAALCADLKKHPEVYDPQGKEEGKRKERKEWYKVAQEMYYPDGDENVMTRWINTECEYYIGTLATEQALKYLPANLRVKYRWKENERIPWAHLSFLIPFTLPSQLKMLSKRYPPGGKTGTTRF